MSLSPGTRVAPIEAWTPPRAARTAASSLGTIPPSKRPSSRPGLGLVRGRTDASSPSRSTPGTSVTNRILSAPIPTASAAAASSALTLSGPSASGATTGTRPSASAASTAGADGSGRPRGRAPRPAAPAGRSRRRAADRARPDRLADLALTAASDSRTTSSTSGVVTRRPSTNSGTIPRRSISAVICGPAPWTTTTSPSTSASAARTIPAATRPPSFTHHGHVVYSALSLT